jgi:hypothetical protein
MLVYAIGQYDNFVPEEYITTPQYVCKNTPTLSASWRIGRDCANCTLFATHLRSLLMSSSLNLFLSEEIICRQVLGSAER